MPRQQTSQKQSSPTPKIYAPPPKIWHATPPVVAGPTIFQSVKDGVGLGVGSAIGHRLVGSIFGSTNPTTMPPPMSSSASMIPEKPYYASDSYIQCVQENREKPDVCKPFLSKEKSPWTICMEDNFFRVDACQPATR